MSSTGLQCQHKCLIYTRCLPSINNEFNRVTKSQEETYVEPALTSLGQWSQSVVTASPRGHLAMSGGSFDCCNWGAVLPVSSG